MNELTFIAALRMHGFRLQKKRKTYIATIGKNGPCPKIHEFYIKIYFYKHRNKHTPFIEITGSKFSFVAYMNYKDAYEFITLQELK